MIQSFAPSSPLLAAAFGFMDFAFWAFLVLLTFIFIGTFFIFMVWGKIWFQAYMSKSRVSFQSLIGMSLRQVDARLIVQGKIMAMQAGVGTDPRTGITTNRLEAHYLAGGNVSGVISAIIAAQRADIDVGENIGARLQADQAEADTRVAQAKAEERRANAIAQEQEMKAEVSKNRAILVQAEAQVPKALATAFRAGTVRTIKNN